MGALHAISKSSCTIEIYQTSKTWRHRPPVSRRNIWFVVALHANEPTSCHRCRDAAITLESSAVGHAGRTAARGKTKTQGRLVLSSPSSVVESSAGNTGSRVRPDDHATVQCTLPRPMKCTGGTHTYVWSLIEVYGELNIWDDFAALPAERWGRSVGRRCHTHSAIPGRLWLIAPIHSCRAGLSCALLPPSLAQDGATHDMPSDKEDFQFFLMPRN